MIDLTVKTLDSQNHPFHVEDDITIRQFKEKISDCLNIPPDSQRLIFCGRVLQDDKKLSEYALSSGNTVHMVQRPPPSQTSGAGGASSRTGATRDSGTGTVVNGRHGNGGIRRSHTFRMRPSNADRNAMYLGAMAYPADLMEAQGIQLPQPSSSLCASRLNIARRMLRRAGDVLAYLENPQTQPPPRNTPSPTTVQVSQAIEVIEVGIGQLDDSMDEGSNIAEAATAAAISAAVSAAQEVGVPNITIYRGASNSSGGNETVIHIEATDNSESNQDDHHHHDQEHDQDESMTDQDDRERAGTNARNQDVGGQGATAAPQSGGHRHQGQGHSRSSSTDSFSSASEFPVAGGANAAAGGANSGSSLQNSAQGGASETSGQDGAANASDRGSNESVSPPNTPLAPLAVLLDELNAVQTRLQPFMTQYHQILLQDPTYPDHSSAVEAQRVYNRVSQVMHLLSHAYHAISDLMVDLHAAAPRHLRCRPILIQHSAVVQTGIPIQAEFNISNMMAEAAAAAAAAGAAASRSASASRAESRPREEVPPVANESGAAVPPAGGNQEEQPAADNQNAPVQPPRQSQQQHQPGQGNIPSFTFRAPTGTTGQQQQQGGNNSHRQNFGFSLPDGITVGGNVEVVMEVTPRYSNRSFGSSDGSGTPPNMGVNAGNNGMGVTIPLQAPSNEMLSNIMQAVAGQIMTRMQGAAANAAAAGTGNANPGQQPQQQAGGGGVQPRSQPDGAAANQQNNANQPGQNSQARVNTATHPTTSTQTRSTARPHVQLRPAGLRLPLGGHLGGVTSSFDPFLPCNSHHLRARRRQTSNGNASGVAANATAANNNNNNEQGVAPGSGGSAVASVTTATINIAPVNASVNRSGVVGASTASPSGSQHGTSSRGNDNAPAALLRDVFASQIVTDSLHNAFVEVLDNAQESGNLILDFIVQLIRRTPLNEVFTMLMGDPSPLVRLRPIIRQFLITRLMANSTPSRAAYEEGTERIIDGLREHFQIMESIRMRDDIDLTATLIALTRARVPDLLSLAVDEEGEAADRAEGVQDNQYYGVRLMQAVRDFVNSFVATVMHCCADGPDGAEEVFRRYVDYVSRGADANLLMFTMSYSVAEFRHYMSTVRVDEADVRRYIRYKDQQQAQDNQAGDRQEAISTRPAPRSGRQRSQSMEVEDDSANATVQMSARRQASLSSNLVPQPDNKAAGAAASPLPQATGGAGQGGAVLPPIEMDLDEAAEPVAAGVVIGSQPWHNALPADWVPIIARDVVRQQRRQTAQQSPMSDAYLQGMPSKRRKLISAEKPAGQLAQSLQDTVRHALQSAAGQVGAPSASPTNHSHHNHQAALTIGDVVSQAANDAVLLTAYREQVRSRLRARIEQDPDYNPALYPNTERRFK